MDPFGNVTAYEYDADGNLTKKQEGGLTTEYTYTADNKLETVRENGELQAAYTYDANGLKAFELLRKEKPGTKTVTEQQSQTARKTIWQTVKEQGILALFTMPWQTSETHSEPNLWAYVAAYTVAGFSPAHREQYLKVARDLWEDVTEFSPWTNPEVSFIGVTQEELAPRRVKKVTTTQTSHEEDIVVVYYEPTLYVYDLTEENPQVLAELASANTTRDAYTYGAAGREARATTGEAKPQYYIYNGRGSVSETVAGGAVSDTFRYDAYGKLLKGEPEQDRVFAFNGEQYTPQTGLQYLRARHYDPSLGAFTSRDTYLGDLKTPISQNRYTYAHNNPVRYADPSGHRLDIDGPRGPATNSAQNIKDSYKPAPSKPSPGKSPSKPKPGGNTSSGGSSSGGGSSSNDSWEEPYYNPFEFVLLRYKALTKKPSPSAGTSLKSQSQRKEEIKNELKKPPKEKELTQGNWWDKNNVSGTGIGAGALTAMPAAPSLWPTLEQFISTAKETLYGLWGTATLGATGLIGALSSIPVAGWVAIGVGVVVIVGVVIYNAVESSSTKTNGLNRERQEPQEIPVEEVPEPAEKHTDVTGRNGSLPRTGEPNSSTDLHNQDGEITQRRFYDDSGEVSLDVDFRHGGNGSEGFPHTHVWK